MEVKLRRNLDEFQEVVVEREGKFTGDSVYGRDICRGCYRIRGQYLYTEQPAVAILHEVLRHGGGLL